MSDICRDPLHVESVGTRTLWSRSNAAEALPGVPTPLNWTLYGESLEVAMRWSWWRLGILTRAELPPRADVDERVWGIFFGRAAINCDTWRWMGDRTPGTSGDAVEMQFFNAVRPGVSSKKVRKRYPAILLKAPWSAWSAARELDRLRTQIDDWWRTAVFSPEGPSSARNVFVEACARFDVVLRTHVLASLIAQGLFDQLQRLAIASSHPGLENTLMTGYGGMEESRLAGSLVALARDELSRDRFLRQHGFHGPAENEVASRSWREDGAPLGALLPRYRALQADAHPASVSLRRKAARQQATRTLLSGLRPHDRARARAVLALAGRFMPLREQGRATLMQTQDVARAAARTIGQSLLARGLLDDAEDVFYLTRLELSAVSPPEGTRELVAFRRAKRLEYQDLEIPSSWEGRVQPTMRSSHTTVDSDVTVLNGLAGSPGVVEGLVRVVIDPSEDLEQDEILVCSTTDPGWSPLFMVASAVVVDIGGVMSHGPIIAREFGLPCVINTVNATQTLSTGDRVRVDGDAGRVEILERAPRPASSSLS